MVVDACVDRRTITWVISLSPGLMVGRPSFIRLPGQMEGGRKDAQCNEQPAATNATNVTDANPPTRRSAMQPINPACVSDHCGCVHH